MLQCYYPILACSSGLQWAGPVPAVPMAAAHVAEAEMAAAELPLAAPAIRNGQFGFRNYLKCMVLFMVCCTVY